eukprot:2122893-Pyramimonas_sp.AAC.1
MRSTIWTRSGTIHPSYTPLVLEAIGARATPLPSWTTATESPGGRGDFWHARASSRWSTQSDADMQNMPAAA